MGPPSKLWFMTKPQLPQAPTPPFPRRGRPRQRPTLLGALTLGSLFLSSLGGLSAAAQTAAQAKAAPPALQTYLASDGTATFSHRVALFDVKGDIAGVSSRVGLDLSDLAATTGTVTVPLARLQTGIAKRDEHAKSERALDTARYPNATFELQTLTGGALREGQTLATTATGTLTVKGVRRRLSVPVKATLQGGRVHVSTQFKFNPHDYGVNYPGSSDSVTVGVRLSLRPATP